MAHVEHFEAKPTGAKTAPRPAEPAASRTHYMLVATVIGSVIIVVVAALFMTMF